MSWPTGEDLRAWMRAQAIGNDALDLAQLDRVTVSATEVISARVDPELLELSGTLAAVEVTGDVATLTTSTAHGLRAGDVLGISGADPADFLDGEHTVKDVTGRRTFTVDLVHDDEPATATAGAFLTVDRCPEAVATAILIRAANFYVRRDSAAGIIRIAPDQAIRINRYDSDVDELLGPFLWGPDPAPGA